MDDIKKSLRDMDFEEVSIMYKNLFSEIVGVDVFKGINDRYRQKYHTFIEYKKKGYNSPTAMGRDKVAYGRNIVYGRFVEELVIEVLKNNDKIKDIQLFGKDKTHDFFYDHDNKDIRIDGEKSTDPDIEIILQDGTPILIELKTANKNIFTIKKGNVESLFRSMANYDKYCLIVMLDLSKGLYEIKDLRYFENQIPFSNANMEGQICFHFPNPSEELYKLGSLDFNSFIDLLTFENIQIKKFKLLKLVIEKENKKRKKIIENKIKLEKLKEEMTINMDDFKDRIKKIKEKIPEVVMSWKRIENEVKKF